MLEKAEQPLWVADVSYVFEGRAETVKEVSIQQKKVL